MTTVQFRVPLPEHESGVVRLKAVHRIAEKAARRLEVRYSVAGVSSAEVEVLEAGTIEVRAAPGTDPGWLEQIAVPDGAFEFGPIVGVGRYWTDVSEQLPDDVEIRQPDHSLEVGEGFLWSRSRSSLREFLQNKQPSGATAFVYPKGDAWRTLAVGDAILDQNNVDKAVVERSPTGAPFVELTLDAGGQHAIGFHAESEQSWLATIDGEAVATVERLGVHGESKLPLRPPGQLTSSEAKEWAKLVAARLAAFIPVDLIPVRNDD